MRNSAHNCMGDPIYNRALANPNGNLISVTARTLCTSHSISLNGKPNEAFKCSLTKKKEKFFERRRSQPRQL